VKEEKKGKGDEGREKEGNRRNSPFARTLRSANLFLRANFAQFPVAPTAVVVVPFVALINFN